jgi:hypothetical protein
MSATPFRFIITANSGGDMAYFPRLHTALRNLRSEIPTLLIDTGRAWNDQIWLCQATENRAPYLVLDAIGYQAAFADGLDSSAREKLQPQLQTQLIEGETGQVAEFQIRRDANVQTPAFSVDVLVLPLPPHGTILSFLATESGLQEITFREVNSTVLPDSTIAGIVEFIEGEAAYYQKKKSDTPTLSI